MNKQYYGPYNGYGASGKDATLVDAMKEVEKQAISESIGPIIAIAAVGGIFLWAMLKKK